MFVDEKKLLIRAGKGGDGAALFRREKYVPYGGPDGGDGGKGGDVIAVGRSNLHALSHLARMDRIEAQHGDNGGHQRSSGHDGADSYCEVPLGTQIFDENDQLLVEILEENQEYVLAKGGNGGWGNWHFKSSIQQAPDRANAGQQGEELHVHLVLKLIADVGLVGLPNAGKSTLLSVVSAAKPKIADYPFTTLEPQLGVVNVGKGADARNFVIADLPGIIEGAHDGKGLGVQFLKHVERTHRIFHCIAIQEDVAEVARAYKTIREELEQWSPVLATKEEVIVLTKSELFTEEVVAANIKAMEKMTKHPVIAISAATHHNLDHLLTYLA